MKEKDLEKLRKMHNFSVSMIITFLFVVFWSLGILTVIYGDIESVTNIIVFTVFIFACCVLPFYLLIVISEHWWIKK